MAEDDWDHDDRTVVGERLSLTQPASEREQPYVIVIAGPNVGEMFKVSVDALVGRGTDVAVRIPDTEISRHHARLSLRNGRVFIEDLGSTNGTFVNGVPIDDVELHDGDKIQVGTTTILKFSYHDKLDEAFQRQMYDAALRDGLTGAFNKKYFLERLEAEVAYTARHGTPLSLLLFDLDHFKRVNDQYGHLAGDYVLVELARRVDRTIRVEDVFARYGGEEFALLSRGIEIRGAGSFAERLRALVQAFPFHHDQKDLPVSISVGVASVPGWGIESAEQLIQAADTALYAAKDAGRNCVQLYQPAGSFE